MQETRRENYIGIVCSILIVIFFLGGIVNHALPFAGMVKDGRSELWHGFNTFLALTAIFSVIFANRLGFSWLLTLFLSQAVVEARGAFLVYGGPAFTEQLFETFLNVFGLVLLFISRRRYAAIE